MQYILYPLIAYFGIAVAYYLIFSIASRFTARERNNSRALINHSIAVFIPAYKEDGIIVDTAVKALRQNYPKEQYTVCVIADSLKEETLKELWDLPIALLQVSFEKSTKARAINKAYQILGKEHDIVVVLDADNVMEDNFLTRVNQAYSEGTLAMQGHRIAKNQETAMALLDGISEEVNNRIFRKGHRSLGMSSALIGSGMAFDYKLFRDYMSRIDAVGGFDKELELCLLRDGVTIEYLEDAYVYDEKVSNTEVFTNQRTRWIAAQIRYGINSFGKALGRLLSTGNIDYFDKSLQFLLPPRLILLGMLFIISGITTLFQLKGWMLLSGLSGAYCLALFLAIPARYLNRSTLMACLEIPKAFFLMIYAIGGYKKAKTNFLHTPHSTPVKS